MLTRPRTRTWCQDQASRIGPRCREVVDGLLGSMPLDRLRAIQGIVGLTDKYASSRVEAACARALHYGDASYRRIKAILAAGTDMAPMEKVVQLKLVSFTFARSADEFFSKEEIC